jgi:lactoylglutathione lyase
MMTGKLYETHLQVLDINRSIAFYEKLGMRPAYKMEKAAFFWFGGNRQQMLGLWEVHHGQPVYHRHFAFEVTKEELLQAKDWLKERGIAPEPAFGKEPIEPIVHSWMPAAAIYFRDPDGNLLEFIALLDGEPRQTDEMLYWSEWNRLLD